MGAACAALAAAAGADVGLQRGVPPGPDWQIIGSFEGAAAEGLLGQINDWLFENERDGDLYQDLGDLNIGIGYDYGGVELDWDNDFRRRVISVHQPLPVGGMVTAADASGYREISQARTRLRLTWDYLPDLLGDVDVGVQVEGGYVVALARSQQPGGGMAPVERLERDGVGREFGEFLAEHDIAGTRNPLYLAAGYGGGVIDMVAGALGTQLADTERAVVFFDDYAEPAVLFPDLGLPLDLGLFDPASEALETGDTITYTAFVGLSPIAAHWNEKGMRASYRRFARFLRETTIERRGPSRVVVRVRRAFNEGNERIPFKYRPELRLLFLSAGYTFFELRRDRFDETTADVTYRIDLAEPEGKAFFAELLADSASVGPLVAPLAPPPLDGVQILRATVRDGPVRDRRLRAKLFSLLRYEHQSIATRHSIETPQVELDEIVRSERRELRKPFGRRRDYSSTVVLTAQAGVRLKQPPELRGRRAKAASEARAAERATAVTLETTIASRRAFGTDLAELAVDLERVLRLREIAPVLRQLEAAGPIGTSGLSLSLRLSFGRPQLERLLAVPADEVWVMLAELLLGTEHRGAWATAARRYEWMPVERTHGRPVPAGEHISRAYDRARGGRPQRGRGLGLSLSHLDSRTLFIRASRLARQFERVRRQLAAGECLPCVADLFEGASDAVVLQALLVSLAGGIGEEDGVGYALEVFTDDLARPLRFGNGIVYTYRHQRRGEMREVYSLEDAPPRLRAGELLVRRDGVGEEGSCWKLRLYSDLLYGEPLRLRAALRDARPGADELLEARFVELPAPATIPAVPFVVARYYYDVPLPWPEAITAGEPYTLLLRVVDPDGRPVSEEQELRVRVPREWAERAPAACPVAVPRGRRHGTRN